MTIEIVGVNDPPGNHQIRRINIILNTVFCTALAFRA